MLTIRDKEIIEEIIHSEEAAIAELLSIQRLLRINKEEYIKRNERQYEEVNIQIDLHQKNIQNNKSKLV